MSNNTKIDFTPEMTRQIATRRVMGATMRDLEGEFGISRPVLTRALNSELGRAIQKELIDSAINGAVLSMKRQLSDLSDLAIEALKENLKKKKMDAVIAYFKVLGLDQGDKNHSPAQAQGINIILPGQVQPKDIEVKREEKEE